MNIWLIRHTSVDVPQGVAYGQTDVPLKSSFPQEAQAVMEKIKEIKFDHVYTSPLSRCTRLADFCGYPDAERDERLLEINFGEWEMKHFDEIGDMTLQEWYRDYLNVRATGGESFMEQYSRVSGFLNELRSKKFKNVALFTHGGVILSAQVSQGLYTVEEAFANRLDYGSVIKINLE